ncbi:MAG: flagellar biosynthetic protein FliO [Deltaproteobacteria bacterium]|nr:flagellar biosynthetic protein FliO [Deltaproteobacteria bacterium]
MIFLKQSLGTAILCSFWAGTAAAADLGGKINETSSLVRAIAKVFGALAVVVALMLLLVYAIKKLGLTNGLTKAGSHIKIIETKMIAPKKYIAIAQISGRQLALGITDHNISFLTDLGDQAVSCSDEAPKSTPESFRGFLQKAVSCLKQTGPNREPVK